MSFLNGVVRSSIFNEFNSEEQEKYFSIKKDKVIFNIDTLYFSVYLNEHITSTMEKFLEALNIFKESYDSGHKDNEAFGMTYSNFHFCFYEYCFRIENMFDIFFSSYLPNENTPRCVVQLRSIGLWYLGFDALIQQSLEKLQQLLDLHNVKIESVKPTRIDYAFHSNLIQNTSKYFNDDVILHNLKTSMRKYMKVGNISDTVEVDYFSLGTRKSNNIFFRTYNKCREVVEMNYKGLFIDLWYDNGLISLYDKYCLEYGYEQGSYCAVHIGRINWYLKYGKDESVKRSLYEIREKYYKNSDNYTYIKKALSGLLPEVTNILNCEFECHSKFFNSLKNLPSVHLEAFDDLESVTKPLFQILRCSRAITDYLTSEVVAFKDGEDYSYWWKRIRQCYVNSMFKGKLIREYKHNLDIDKQRTRLLNAVSALSIYKKKINNNPLAEDIADALSCLNDNDIANITIDKVTGESLELKYGYYDIIKKRKQRQIKPLLPE